MVPFEEGSIFLNGILLLWKWLSLSIWSPRRQTIPHLRCTSRSFFVYDLPLSGHRGLRWISFTISRFSDLVPKDFHSFFEGSVDHKWKYAFDPKYHIQIGKYWHTIPGIDPEKMKDAERIYEIRKKPWGSWAMYEKLEAELRRVILNFSIKNTEN